MIIINCLKIGNTMDISAAFNWGLRFLLELSWEFLKLHKEYSRRRTVHDNFKSYEKRQANIKVWMAQDLKPKPKQHLIKCWLLFPIKEWHFLKPDTKIYQTLFYGTPIFIRSFYGNFKIATEQLKEREKIIAH